MTKPLPIVSPAPSDTPSGTLNVSVIPASTPSVRLLTPIMSALLAVLAHSFPTEFVLSEIPSVPHIILMDLAIPAQPEIRNLALSVW
jgi:hypothetical protein